MPRLLNSKPSRRPSRRPLTSQASRDTTTIVMPHSTITLASRLDLEASAELQLGHHAAAERLAHKAAALRGWA
jgi:hypothetical protein